MSGLFEHLAAFDDSERVAARKAAAVANKRVKDQVGDFLANATSPEDFESRLSLVDDDIKTAVADVVAEYGGDAERVEAAVRRSIADSSASESSDSESDADEDDDNYSASCKHCEGKGCLKCKEAKSCNCWDGYERVPGTEPCSPGSCRKCDDHRKSSDQSIDEQLAEAPSAVGNTSLENGEVEEKPNFLAAAALADGDETGHRIVPMTPEHGDALRLCIPDRDAPNKAFAVLDPAGNPVAAFDDNTVATGNNEHYDIPRHDVDTNAGWSGEPNNGNYPRMAADAPEGSGGAVKREKLPKGNADATGAPSPKIDKSKAGDEKGHKKRDIDTEYDNSPVPEWRDKQDVTTGRGDAEKGTSDYTHSSPELTSDTLTQEDLPTGNEDAQSTERNIEQNKTETFPNKGQADPVTSSVSERIDSLMKRATEMSNRYAAAAHTVKEENGEFFVIEDGNEKAAGPFSSQQEAQSRATELNSKENLEKGSSIDPDKNPIQEILNDFNQDQSAVAEFERKAMTDPSCNCNGNCNGTCQR